MSIIQLTPKDEFPTIDSIAATLNIQVKHRGFLRESAAIVPSINGINTIYWWPSEQADNWDNYLSPDGCVIYEKSSTNNKSVTPQEHIQRHLNTGELRVSFFKHKGGYYRFVGVFELNKEASRKFGHCIWERKYDMYPPYVIK